MKLKYYNKNIKHKKITIFYIFKKKKKKINFKVINGSIIKAKRSNYNIYFKLLIKIKNNKFFYNFSSSSPFFLFYKITS
ncbi:hypothetical protein ACWNX6_00325 [Candidatus Vidania fulgoroideorum]